MSRMADELLKTYKALNKEQRRAVDMLDGPLLVIAGPGTGKTQLLSARVANILDKTDTLPQNILCLTFTEKAATNMRERLLSMIGAPARNVVVKTFHGLAAEIISRYPEYFWNGARLEPAPEAIKLEVIDDILNALPLDNPLALKFAGENTLVSEAQKGIQRAKEAGLTPQKLEAITSANLAYIQAAEPLVQPLIHARVSLKTLEAYRTLIDSLPQESFGKAIAPIQPLSTIFKLSLMRALEDCEALAKATPLSTWKAEWFETADGQKVFRDTKRNQWWSALAGVYRSYQEVMSARGYFDFADMILEVITQLESNETLRADLQEQYAYILIDEFQDTNDGQFRLAYLIAHHAASEGRPNIMAVGDDDQAIYRFQGAQLSNVETFITSFRDTTKIVLRENYRSHQQVLDTAAQIADQIEHRLVTHDPSLDKRIRAASQTPAGQIEHILYPTRPHELTGLSALIATYFQSDGGTIAVLARSHDSLQSLAALLLGNGIPVRYARAANVLEYPAVQLVIELLELLAAIPTGKLDEVNLHLSKVLAYEVFGIPAQRLWQLALEARRDRDWLSTLARQEEPELTKLSTWLLELSKTAQTQPLSITLEHVLGLRTLAGTHSPLKQYYSTEVMSDQYVRTLSGLSRLRSLATEFGKGRSPTLTDFTHFLTLNQAYGVMIADQSTFVTADRAVELMTVHGAKGLEYDTVFVMDGLESIWKPSARRRIPPQNLESLQQYGEDADDYARLMFVAATRARSSLLFTSYQQDEQGRAVLPTPLIHAVPRVEAPASTLKPATMLEQVYAWPELDHTEQRLLFKPLLENYQLSVTHLLNFLDLKRGGPRCFIERNLLQLPSIKSGSLAFGTAMHEALRQAQVDINADNFSVERVEAAFDKALKSENLTTEQEERYLTHGRQLIIKLLDKRDQLWPKGAQPERSLNNVGVGEAQLRGDLDRLDISPEQLLITDYKTGRPLTVDLTSQARGDEGLRAWKHRLQLVFYALLVREGAIATPRQTVTGQMIYLESTTQKEFVRAYTPDGDDLDQLRKLIASVWRHIQAADWPDVSGYSPDFSGVQAFMDDLVRESSR